MSERSVESPVRMAAGALRSGWNALLTIYYANSLSWRALKSGALVFLGFFLWAGSNILLAYQPGWTPLRYVMAYGFVLIGYGPFHHLVVIPVYQRLRRRGRNLTLGSHLHLPNLSLLVFLAIVVVLGTFPAGPMTIDFTTALEESGADIDPDLLCVKSTGETGATVHCHLSESRGVGRVVVESGGERVLVDEEPPYEFTVHERELASVTGQKQFLVILEDEEGNMVRRHTRTLSMIDEG